MMMSPENQLQKDCGTMMKMVDALRRSVKITSERPSDAMMTSARILFAVPPVIEPPTMTGRSGSTHGASTVSMPAMNEMRRSAMRLLYLG